MAQKGPSVPPPPSLVKTDPFAQTVLGDSLEKAVPPPQVPGVSVSPMAASVMASPSHMLRAVQGGDAAARSNPPPAAPPPVHRTPPPPSPVYGPGSRVLVQWSDGHRYEATVREANGPHLLVVFSNNAAHWVEQRFVSPHE